MRVNKLENQVEVLTDLIADNKKLKEKVELLTHLRRMDLEFLCILVWGYGIDKDKYNAMDKRIYSGYSTYKKHTYDWDWLMDYVADEEDTGAIFDRIELINNEVKRDKEEKQRKELEEYELYLKQKEEQKKKEEEEKIVLTLTPEIIEKAKNGELDETK
jgi:leucyl aminopeptidase